MESEVSPAVAASRAVLLTLAVAACGDSGAGDGSGGEVASELANLSGTIESDGTATLSQGTYGGNGQVKYDGIFIDGYSVGSGHFSLSVDKKLARLTDFVARYAKGEVRSKELQVELHDRFAIR